MDQQVRTTSSGFLCLITILMIYPLPQMAVDIYLPSWPNMVNYFQASENSMKLSLLLYLFFLGIAQVIYGGLSEKYGRKIMLILGIIIFLISSICCALANSIAELIFFRIWQGLGIGCGFTIASAMLSDLYEGKKLAKMSSYSAIVYSLSVIFSPAIGGYVQQYLGWKANFLLMAVYSIVLLVFVIIFVDETKPLNFRTNSSFQRLKNTYWKIFQNLVFVRFVFCLIIAYGIMVAFNVVAPFLMQVNFGLSSVQYGKSLLFIGVAYTLGSAINSYIVKYFSLKLTIIYGFVLMFISSVCMFTMIFYNLLNVIGLVSSISLAFFSVGFIYPNCLAKALSCIVEKGFASGFVGCAILIGVSLSSLLALNCTECSEYYLCFVLMISSIIGLFLVNFETFENAEEANIVK